MKQTKVSKKRNAASFRIGSRSMVSKCTFKKNHLNVLKFYVLKKITTESLKLDRPPPFSVCNYQSP